MHFTGKNILADDKGFPVYISRYDDLVVGFHRIGGKTDRTCRHITAEYFLSVQVNDGTIIHL